MTKALLVSLVCFVTIFLRLGSSECAPYQGDYCHDYIRDNDVAVAPGNQQLINILLGTLGWDNITNIMDVLAPQCSHVAQAFLCNNYYPPCDPLDNPIPVCQQTCIDFKNTCGEFLNTSAAEGIAQYLPDCATFPTQNCNNLDFVPPLDVSTINCPAPLIFNPDPTVKRENCPGDYCCIPCPFAYNFFPEKKAENILLSINILALIFSFPCYVAALSYFIIPSKRRFPQMIIGEMLLALSLCYLSIWMGVIGGNSVICDSPVDQAEYTNTACAVQGSFIIYFIYALLLWFFSLAFNIFVLFFFKLETGLKGGICYNILSWGVPFIPIAFVNAQKKIAFSVMNTCSLVDLNEQILFNPIAAVLFTSSAMIVATFVKVGYISKTSKQSINVILKLQARPLGFTTYCVCTFIGYWIYSKTTPGSVPNEALVDWFICIALGNGQNACSPIMTKHLPTIGGYGTIWFFVQLLGLVSFFVFFCKDDVYEGWRKVLLGTCCGPFLSKYLSSPSSKTTSSLTHSKTERSIRELTQTDGDIELQN